MSALSGRFALIVVVIVGMVVAGCVSGPHGSGGVAEGYRGGRCVSCGVVQDVRLIDASSAGPPGVVMGGAVSAGAPGSEVGDQRDGNAAAWHIVVRLDDGQYVTVTQRGDSGVRNGDYVELRGGQVYER